MRGLNDGPLQGVGRISCWSCHRGLTIPARLPAANWESIAAAHAADFAGARENLGLAMSVYAASLGVDCSHCHVERDWTDTSRPARQMVTVMSRIFELIPHLLRQHRTDAPGTQCYMCHQGRTRVEPGPAVAAPATRTQRRGHVRVDRENHRRARQARRARCDSARVSQPHARLSQLHRRNRTQAMRTRSGLPKRGTARRPHDASLLLPSVKRPS